MKVILALDEFQHSEAALKSVSKRAWPRGTEITLLSVIDLGLYDQDGWDTETMIDLSSVNKFLLARRHQYLDMHMTRLKRTLPDVVVKKSVLQGRARESIIKAIRADEPDLLVMGTHGHKGAKKLILGSVAQSVLVEALCPCEVVKSDSYDLDIESLDEDSPIETEELKDAFKVFVCVQDKKCIDYLSQFVVDYPLPENVEFRLFHASVPVMQFNFLDLDGGFESLKEQISTERWRLGKKYLFNMAKKLSLVSRFDKVAEVVKEGDPRHLVMDEIESWKPNLVILGSHAKKGIMSLGSVSRHIVNHCDCSVVTVPLLDKEEKREWLSQENKLHIIV